VEVGWRNAAFNPRSFRWVHNGVIYVGSISARKVRPRGLFHPTEREAEKSDITPHHPLYRKYSHTQAMEWHSDPSPSNIKRNTDQQVCLPSNNTELAAKNYVTS
jgi:hypothetical protein